MVNKGKKMREEQKRKLSEALKGKNNPMYGKSVSDKTRRKISKAKKGQEPWNKDKIGVYSKATRRKMSEAQKGRKKSL